MVFTALNRMRYASFSSPSLDKFVFKLCYRWTVLLLVVFSFIVTCRLVLGDSISCASNIEFTKSHINTICYSVSTYTLPKELFAKKGEAPTLHPPADSYRKYQTYYSWVNLFFLVHAFNFYLPHLLWKTFESGYMYKLTAGVQKYFKKEEKRGLEISYLAKYVLLTEGKHRLYTTMYILFEVITYSVALAQTFWLVYFFDVLAVPDSLPVTLETWSDFKQFYFPETAKCDLRTIGAAGIPILYVARCEMALNRLFMIMYLFLHVWYIFITILTGMVLIYRIALFVPPFRMFSAKIFTNLAERSVLRSLCGRMSYSDWFFLSRLQKSMSDVDFAQMLNKIALLSQGTYVDMSSISEERMKDFASSGDSSVL